MFLYYEPLSELMLSYENGRCPFLQTTLFYFRYLLHKTLKTLNTKKSTFSRIGAKLWNEIPSSLRELQKKLFKLRIKNILLSVPNFLFFY